jgi:hypothetical protein
MTAVAICIPSADHVLAECAYAIPSILGAASRAGIKTAVLNSRGASPAHNLNQMFAQAMKAGFDYVLSLDADMLVPHDVIPRLLAHDKPIVGTIARRRGGDFAIIGADMDGKPFAPPFAGLVEALHLGGGCMLIRRDVIEAVPCRRDYFDETGLRATHDVVFCHDARAAGFPIFADMDVSREVYHCGVHRWGCRRDRRGIRLCRDQAQYEGRPLAACGR